MVTVNRGIMPPRQVVLHPDVWGPHYWFVLHTIAYTYPEHPTNVTKRKYYDLIQNLPLFLPDETMGDLLAEFLDKYPVSPYLDSRESFMRWMHFLHNRFNVHLGKPPLSMYAALDAFYEAHQPRVLHHARTQIRTRDIIYVSILLALVLGIYTLSRT